MLVKCSQEVPFSQSAVQAELLKCGALWLQPFVREGWAQGRQLWAEIGSMAAGCAELRLELGLPLTYADAVSIPFQLRNEDVERGLSVDNVLTATWFGDSRTQLILESSYGQPTWLSAPEQMLLHRVVESVTRQFLGRVAAELSDRLCGSP